MANILVYIEMDGDRPSVPSLEALGEGRRIASYLGATLGAVLPCAIPPRYHEEDAIAVLSRHGADKVVLSPGPDLGLPMLHATHGQTLAAATDRLPPTLVILAATPGGRDVAPRAAARLGAAYVPEPSVEYGPRGDLVLTRAVYGWAYRRRLTADECERPIVVTLTPGSYAPACGDEEAEVIILETTPPPALVEETARAHDGAAALDDARVVVVAGAGVTREEFALIEELATALGGEVGVTRTAARRGLGSPEREVGAGGRRVAPRLYVACAASGSPEHLAGVSADAHIVAINRDPRAPIFRVATYGMVGEVGEIVPRLSALLRGSAS